MKHVMASVLILLGSSLLQAQTADKAAPSASKAVAKPSTSQAARAPTKASKPVLALAQLNAAELAVAQRVYIGRIPCELGALIHIEGDAHAPGYFHLKGKGFTYHLRPVETSTGAIRLEDVKAGAVWLQLANKSMLMDQKQGKRVADDCASPEQIAFAETLKTRPATSLLDGPAPSGK